MSSHDCEGPGRHFHTGKHEGAVSVDLHCTITLKESSSVLSLATKNRSSTYCILLWSIFHAALYYEQVLCMI